MKLERAIILAAGLGTRMRPLTDVKPKPLIPVAGKPLIDYSLEWLAEAGIHHVVINTSYLAQQLEDYLSDRDGIQFSRELEGPLETGGGIAKALPMLGQDPFLAMNSDAIFAPAPHHPILRLAQEWNEDLDFLMLVLPKKYARGWEGRGDFALNDANEIRRPREGEDAPYIFTGVEVIHPRVFEGCPQGKFSLSHLWKQRLRADGFHARMRAVVHEGAWLNVGDLHGLREAEAYYGVGA